MALNKSTENDIGVPIMYIRLRKTIKMTRSLLFFSQPSLSLISFRRWALCEVYSAFCSHDWITVDLVRTEKQRQYGQIVLLSTRLLALSLSPFIIFSTAKTQKGETLSQQ